VGDVVGVLAVLRRRVVEQVERLEETVSVRSAARLKAVLIEDRGAVGVLGDAGVGEAPGTRQRAEVVVEAAVFLHEDHDVLDVAQACARGGGGDLVDQPRLLVRDVARTDPAGRGRADGGRCRGRADC
jgi:hypothetical protein